MGAETDHTVKVMGAGGAMHECPECGMACDCDGEDLWNDAAAKNCTHECEDDEEYEEGFRNSEEMESDDDMLLPPGTACTDCAHFKRCEMLGVVSVRYPDGHCDWSPSRFRPRAERDPKEEGEPIKAGTPEDVGLFEEHGDLGLLPEGEN